jgi:hypothetical protein
MIVYKIKNLPLGGAIIIRLSDNAFIPFDPANTDYAQFKKDILDGAELLDADGQVIDGIAYLQGLA